MIFTIAAVLTLQAGILFAGNDNYAAPVTNKSSVIALAPVVPMEATFEELDVTVIDAALLAPVIPAEVTFEDFTTDMITPAVLAPAIPAAADFEDVPGVASFENKILAPVTPAEADFE